MSAAKAPTAETQSVKEDLKAVLASRYNAEARLLDLSALGQDPILVSKGFFEEASRAVKAFSALITIASGAYKSAQEKKEGVQYVSLANNALDNVAHVFDLAKHFPGIVGLDLSNNQFSKITQLGRWRHHFPELSELRLAGNPLVAEEPNLETEVKAWFPKLLQLDGKLVRTPAEVAAQAPIPIPQVGFDFRDTSGLGEGFLREFFALYDADRAALAKKFYDEDSTFSAAIIVASIKGSDKAILPWKPYLRFSRNIKFLGARNNENRRRLFRGAQFISDVWKQLPATKHVPIEEIDKWVVDAHIVHDLADPTGTGTTVDGLVITVNGEFEELSEAGKAGHRTFSRHFLLGPAKPGRGTIIRVISDQITLRGHQPIAVNSPQAPMPPNGLDDALKLKMVQELSERTGMTLEYSQLCLSGEANWHFHLALRSFDALCGTLPADAFINGKPSHVA